MRRPPRTTAWKTRGFTLVELLVATSVAMVLLYAALFSSLETFAVVRQGDTEVQSQVHARRTLERLVKDIRYSSALTISGDQASGWTIDLETGIDAAPWTWEWDPATDVLTVSDGVDTTTALAGLQDFALTTEASEGGETARVVILWTVLEESGGLTGTQESGQTLQVSGSTWIRRVQL